MSADGAQDIQAVHVGQAEIQQGGIEPGPRGGEGQQGIPTGADGNQAEAFPEQVLFQAEPDLSVVFEEEDAGHRRLCV